MNDALRANGLMYSASFFEAIDRTSSASAAVFAPLLVSLFMPQRVLDVACGTGAWLRAFKAQGVGYTLGIEGPWTDATEVGRQMDRLVIADLSSGFPTLSGARFDLAISIEVAEHLDRTREQDLVRFLTSHADVIVFSAAIPGQGGTHHVNERWQSHWANLFGGRGYHVVDEIRRFLWEDDRIDPCLRQNLLVYVHGGLLREVTERLRHVLGDRFRTVPLDVVHPRLFEERMRVITTNPAAIESHLTLRLVSRCLHRLAWRAVVHRLQQRRG